MGQSVTASKVIFYCTEPNKLELTHDESHTSFTGTYAFMKGADI